MIALIRIFTHKILSIFVFVKEKNGFLLLFCCLWSFVISQIYFAHTEHTSLLLFLFLLWFSSTFQLFFILFTLTHSHTSKWICFLFTPNTFEFTLLIVHILLLLLFLLLFGWLWMTFHFSSLNFVCRNWKKRARNKNAIVAYSSTSVVSGKVKKTIIVLHTRLSLSLSVCMFSWLFLTKLYIWFLDMDLLS